LPRGQFKKALPIFHTKEKKTMRTKTKIKAGLAVWGT